MLLHFKNIERKKKRKKKVKVTAVLCEEPVG